MFVLGVDERNGFFLYFFEPPFFTNEVMFIPPSKESFFSLVPSLFHLSSRNR